MESRRPLATDDEFCAFASISKQQSAQLRYLGLGPRFIRVTGRQIRYAWSDIEAWCEMRTVNRSDERGKGPTLATGQARGDTTSARVEGRGESLSMKTKR